MAHTYNVDSFFLEATSETEMGDAFDFTSGSRRPSILSRRRRSSALRKGSFALPASRKGSVSFSRKSSIRRESLWVWEPEEFLLPEADYGSDTVSMESDPWDSENFLAGYKRRRSSARFEIGLNERRRSSVRVEMGLNERRRSSVRIDTAAKERRRSSVRFAPIGAPEHRRPSVRVEVFAQKQPLALVPEFQSESEPQAPAVQAPVLKTFAAPTVEAVDAASSDRLGAKPNHNKKIRKPMYWTPEDHTKFLMGLEKFGLEKGLGRGGAELMSVYMGNRTILQIKSHFQQHLANKAAGRA